jgi:hypothetical protein
MAEAAPTFIIIIVAVMIGLGVAVFAWLHYLAQQKRREAMGDLAIELGWNIDPWPDNSHDEEYAHFEIFTRGHSRSAYNTLTGYINVKDHDWPAKMGDFTYKVTRSSGKRTQTTTYRFSYMILETPYMMAPALLIRPEGFMDKLAGAFGFDDIDFESEEFSRRFHVKSRDKKFAYDICHPRMMAFLLATRPPCVDIERGRCCISDGSRCWEPEQFRATVHWVQQFYDQWPDHVVKELGAR